MNALQIVKAKSFMNIGKKGLWLKIYSHADADNFLKKYHVSPDLLNNFAHSINQQ